MVAKDKNNEFSAGSVTFEPGERTNWHTHPKGQVLIVIKGDGLYLERGKPSMSVRKGAVVIIPENTEHCRGASSTDRRVHIAKGKPSKLKLVGINVLGGFFIF